MTAKTACATANRAEKKAEAFYKATCEMYAANSSVALKELMDRARASYDCARMLTHAAFAASCDEMQAALSPAS